MLGKLSAVRVPGPLDSTLRLCDWILRMRAVFPDGWITIFWPRSNEPPVNVPVTTVPMPWRLKTRSTGRRGLPISRGGAVSASTRRERGFQIIQAAPADDGCRDNRRV